MSARWLVFVPRIVLLSLLIVMTCLDWKVQSNLRRIIAAKDQLIAAQNDPAFQQDVYKFRLNAAIAQIRKLNGNHAVQLPNPDGTFYIDRLDPGESISIEIPLHIEERK